MASCGGRDHKRGCRPTPSHPTVVVVVALLCCWGIPEQGGGRWKGVVVVGNETSLADNAGDQVNATQLLDAAK